MSMLCKHLRLLAGVVCLMLPAIGCDDEPSTPAAPDATVEPEPAPDPEANPEPEGEPEPDPDPEPEGAPDPEPTPVDPARAVEPELLLDGPVPLAVPLPDGRVVARAGDAVALIAPDRTLDFGAEAGALNAAGLVDGQLLVSTDLGLFARVDDGLMPSPLGALLDGVTALDTTADGALWIIDAAGLHVYREGRLSGVDPGPMGAGAMTAVGAWADTPALWVVGDEALYAVGFGDEGLQAWELAPEAPVDGVAVNDLGGLWIAADGTVSHLADDGTWSDLLLPFAVTALAAHPAAPDVWLVGDDRLWQLRDGRVRPIEGVGAFSGLRGELDGSVLIWGDAGLQRVRPGRFVHLDGVDDGGVVDRITTVEVSVTSPEDVQQLTLRIDGGDARALEGPPYTFELEPGPIPEGAHTLEVAADYADGERVVAELRFRVQGPPTWEGDVAPIFFEHCDACHGERGYAHRMETMDVWLAEFDQIVDAIVGNRMPLPPNPSVTPEQLELIRAWGETGFLRSWP